MRILGVFILNIINTLPIANICVGIFFVNYIATITGYMEIPLWQNLLILALPGYLLFIIQSVMIHLNIDKEEE